MAMHVATGQNTFNDTSDNFQKKNIIVTEASKEKRERVLELLTPDLRLKVLNIYRVIPKEQEKKFKQYVKDRNISEIKSLWHGSRNENWLSIAENGLMLHPNAAITGKMFGNGIYFASSAKKSWGYTSGGFWTREMSSSTRFMGLYATAYGNPLNVTSPSNYSEKSIGNFNCVHAHAGNYLRNDEIIFYNEAAMLLTYLVEFSAQEVDMIRIVGYMYRGRDRTSFIAYDEISDRGEIISLVTDGKRIWKIEDFSKDPNIITDYAACDVTDIYQKLKQNHNDALITKYLDSIKIA